MEPNNSIYKNDGPLPSDDHSTDDFELIRQLVGQIYF